MLKKQENKKARKQKSPFKKRTRGIKPSDLLKESREFLEPRKTAALSRGGAGKMDVSPELEGKEAVFSFGQKQRENMQKKMIMWSGISFFMALVFVVWIFNTKKIFQETAMTAPQGEKQELGEIFQELDSVMQEAKEGLDSLGNIEQDKAGNKLPVNGETDKIDELKMKLEGQNRE